ncbi:MAG: VCBS repeat-containing protein [Gemmatimonadales bacterium]|nr:MAG: VCBS repeat-containing protein [Gemmatimonadales bacterium]
MWRSLHAAAVALGVAAAVVACGSSETPSPGTPSPAGPPGTGAAFERDVYLFDAYDAEGRRYDHPWLGGLLVPRPQFVDIDNDGDPDLFLQERSGELMFFENIGSAGSPDFRWRTDRFQDLEIGQWYVFQDLTGDGRKELMSELRFSYMQVYRNEGTLEEPRFELALDSIRDVEGRPIFADRQNIPYVTDLDCSGTLDLFLGRVDGSITHLREAERVDGWPRFERVTDYFENIAIIGQIGSMHGANAMAFIDMTGNGALDLLWGDYFEPSVLLIENTATCPDYDLDNPPEPLYTPDGNISTSGHNVPVPADLGGEGDMDLVVGVLGGAFNPNLTASANLHHYERGADGLFRKQTEQFLFGVDIGEESFVEVADVTGNGRPDLVGGNKLDPANTRTARLYLFENREGEDGRPEFHLADTISLAQSYNYAPAMGELFGSGRPDLVLGTWNDGIRVYRNLGHDEGDAAGFPRFEEVEELAIELPRGSHGTPALGDLTGNGLLDLVAGRSSGHVALWQNTGTAESPRFELVDAELGDIRVGRRSAPYLADVTGDGRLDLLVSQDEGAVLLFRNTGNAAEPRFELDEDFSVSLFGLGRAVPVDLDGSGELDLVSGNKSGGILIYRNRGGGFPDG